MFYFLKKIKEFIKIIIKFIIEFINKLKREPYVDPVNIDNGNYRRFGYKLGTEFHCGHDYNCPADTLVFAILDGEVLRAELIDGFGGFDPILPGGAALIKHIDKNGNPFVALYGHIELEIESGQKVKRGQVIGTIIDYYSSLMNLPHLHFGIHLGNELPTGNLGYVKILGKWVEPRNFLEKNC